MAPIDAAQLLTPLPIQTALPVAPSKVRRGDDKEADKSKPASSSSSASSAGPSGSATDTDAALSSAISVTSAMDALMKTMPHSGDDYASASSVYDLNSKYIDENGGFVHKASAKITDNKGYVPLPFQFSW